MFSFLFILCDISLFSVLSFPVYKLFCSEYDYEIFSFLQFLPIKFNSILVNPLFSDISFLDNILNTNLFFFPYPYSIFSDNSVLFEFRFSMWFFTTNNTLFSFNLISNLFDVALYTRRTTFGIVEFYSLQKTIKIFVDEVTLIFFRLYNPVNYRYGNIFIYLIYPQYFGIYLSKVQCFCFESIIVNAFEVLDLPVLFLLSSDIKLELISSFPRIGLLYVHFIS